MKKVALSLLAFALVGAGAFADAAADVVKAPVTFSLDVNGSAAFGTDLDTSAVGFQNGHAAAITLWFLNGSSEKTGDGQPHGYIKVADVKLGTDDAAAVPVFSIGDVTAKIVAGDLYIKLYTVTDPSVGYAFDADNDNGGNTADDTYKTISTKYGATATEWNFANISSFSTIISTGGIEVGYTIPSVVGLTFGAGSATDWSSNTTGDFEGSAEASILAVDKLTLKFKGYAGSNADVITTAAGASLGYDLGVIAPFADVNYNVKTSKYTSDFGAKAPLADGVLLTAVGTYDSDAVINALVTLGVAADKVAGPLNANLGVQLLDVTKAAAANTVTEILAKVGFKASDVLAIHGTIDTYNLVSSTDSSLFAKADVEFTGISLTTIGVYFDSSDLGAAKATGTSKLGQVKLQAKVTY